MNDTTTLPLWKNALDAMREEGLDYGKTWTADYFEKYLREDRHSQAFAFEMMALRHELEKDEGLYLKSEESGARWSIVEAAAHEDVAARFDGKVRRYAVRSINLRSATLMNPKAKLTQDERAKMEGNLERASLRLVLMSRSHSIAEVVKAHEPKLLEKRRQQ